MQKDAYLCLITFGKAFFNPGKELFGIRKLLKVSGMLRFMIIILMRFEHSHFS